MSEDEKRLLKEQEQKEKVEQAEDVDRVTNPRKPGEEFSDRQKPTK
jgi:hypothetical protein